MIFAPIVEFATYLPMHRLFEQVEKSLITMDFDSVVGQKVIIEGDSLFAMPSFNKARLMADAPLEAHNRYIDIQICLQGEETIGWRDRAECLQSTGQFDYTKDIIFYNDAPTNFIKLQPRTFAIFYPADCHAPLIGEGFIKKVVFKVAVL